MNIIYFSNHKTLDRHAADIVIRDLKTRPDALVCLATGQSPLGLYQELAYEAELQPDLFAKMRVLKLDEWGGLPMSASETCEQYIQSKFLHPLNIPKERYLAFESDPEDPIAECERIQSRLNREGPIDLCVLGLGKNGHLGFNEPGPFLQADCHVATLSDTSMQHNMVHSANLRPTYGMTVGMGGILQSKRIILLISGEGKEAAVKGFLSKKVSTSLPASFLWLHANVDCLIHKP